MEQYINKSAVVAEIKKMEKHSKRKAKEAVDVYWQIHFDGWVTACRSIMSFIDTLEGKDVDLEKEVINWWNAHYSSKAYTFEGYTGHYVENSTLIEIAKHFFELGMAARNKAQKGE